MKESKGSTVKFRVDGQLPAGMQPVKTDDRPIIDYSDAPELSDAWFEQASRGGAASSQETGQHAY